MTVNSIERAAADPASVKIALEESGETFACKPSVSVLQAMASLGRKGIPLGCLNGGCGVCKIKVVAGQYRCGPMSRAHVTESEEADALVLACRTFPKSDLIVKVVGKMGRTVFRYAAIAGPERQL
jgi:ferredoxin